MLGAVCRKIAGAAVARGWLDGAAVWDLAERFFTTEQGASPRALFGALLKPGQLDELMQRADTVAGDDAQTVSELPVALLETVASGKTPEAEADIFVEGAQVTPGARYSLGEELG